MAVEAVYRMAGVEIFKTQPRIHQGQVVLPGTANASQYATTTAIDAVKIVLRLNSKALSNFAKTKRSSNSTRNNLVKIVRPFLL